jgi:hypothetical protein
LNSATFSLRMRYVRMLPRRSPTRPAVLGAVGVAVEVAHPPTSNPRAASRGRTPPSGPRCRSDGPDRSGPASAS